MNENETKTGAAVTETETETRVALNAADDADDERHPTASTPPPTTPPTNATRRRARRRRQRRRRPPPNGEHATTETETNTGATVIGDASGLHGAVQAGYRAAWCGVAWGGLSGSKRALRPPAACIERTRVF